jgi:ribosomal protein L11 methyltransferase
MSWLEIKFQCDSTDVEALDSVLENFGAVSVTLTDAKDQPLFEPPPGETPLWQDVVITALFPEEYIEESASTQLLLELQATLPPNALTSLQHSILVDRDWVRAWLDDFKPMQFGQKLWVCPSWWDANGTQNSATKERWQPDQEQTAYWIARNQAQLTDMQAPGNTVLLLDPGLAFGTGTHPTTALCLQWLESQAVQGQTLVDFGCGSGILGIAALLLGANKVYGIDNDPQALIATADNCKKNQLDPTSFPIFLPSAFTEAVSKQQEQLVDGMMANILAGTLIQLSKQLSTLVKPTAWLLLSGILREQASSVIAAYEPWFKDFVVAAEGDWVRITAVRH